MRAVSDRREEKCHHMLYSLPPLCNSRCSNTTVVAVTENSVPPSKAATLCPSFLEQGFQQSRENIPIDKLTLLLY